MLPCVETWEEEGKGGCGRWTGRRKEKRVGRVRRKKGGRKEKGRGEERERGWKGKPKQGKGIWDSVEEIWEEGKKAVEDGREDGRRRG